MALASPISDVELLILEVNEWAIQCNHMDHPKLQRGHTDTAPVMAVQALPLPCCGRSGKATFLCSSWIAAHDMLRCPWCDKNGLLFEECYKILGPA